MKKMKLAAAGLLALSSSLAYADGYLGVSMGQAEIDLDGFDKSTSYSITGGVKFNKYVAAELAYVKLGGFDATYVPGVAFNADGLNTSIIGIWPVTEEFNLFAKAGLYIWTPDFSGVDIEFKDETDFNYGIGASYSFTKHWEVSFGYHMFKLTDINATNLSAGIQYNF